MCCSVTEFSKKTGDYPSLSATDIKVLALTYQLELEHVGSQHLKKEPEVKVIRSSTQGAGPLKGCDRVSRPAVLWCGWTRTSSDP